MQMQGNLVACNVLVISEGSRDEAKGLWEILSDSSGDGFCRILVS